MLKQIVIFCLLVLVLPIAVYAQVQTEFPAALENKWWFSIKNKKVNKIRYSKEGYKGDSALVIQNGEGGWNNYAGWRKGIAVKEGDRVSCTVMIRGKGRAGLFVKFLDGNGKQVAVKDKSITKLKYQFAAEAWKPMQIKFRTPKGIARVTIGLRSIGERGEIFFSALKVAVESGLILKNDKLTAVFNPVAGGMIDSLVLAENNFDFTRKDLVRDPGGLFRDFIPGDKNPGLFSREYYTATVLEPGRRIRFSRLNQAEELKGLRLDKEFALEPGSTTIKVVATFTNTSKKSLKTSYRVHNIISNATGTFSWPLNDWVQVFKYDSADPYGIYKIHAAPIRSGWFARTYEGIDKTLLFRFTQSEADKGFSYLNKRLNTLELYYREFTLEAAESRAFHYSLSVIPSQSRTGHYLDAYGKKQPVQKIVLKKMPKVPEKQTVLPEKYRNHFPFVVRLGHTVYGVRSGGKGNFGKDLVFENTKAAIDNYCNGVYSWNIGLFSKINDKNGKNVYGEMLRRLDATYSEIHHICQKSDIEITPDFINKVVPPRLAKLRDKDVQKFLKNYNDRMLCVYSADEIEGQNAETMMYLHNEAAKLLPEDVLIFPYLMVTGEPLLPYLPVFVLDAYPFHVDLYGGRDPWRIYSIFKRVVASAGKNKPVWFMPQGFGGKGYVMPNGPETKLMLNLSVAAGVKGIVYYGLMSHGWPWVYNGYDDISCFGAAGQYTDCWLDIGSVARQLGAVGSLIARSEVVPVPGDITIVTRTFNADKFNSVKKLYRGPAVGIDALKTPEGLLLCVINRNVYEAETAEISFGKKYGKILDVESMQLFQGGKRKLTLQPGSAAYFFLGKTAPIRDEIFRGMFLRERARYRLFLDQALANGIKHTEPAFAKLAPEKAYKGLLADFEALRKKVDATIYGRCLRLMEQAKKNLYPIDELFVNNLDIVVSKAMKKHKRYPAHEDPEVEKSRKAIYEDFFRINSFNLALVNGKAETIVKDLEAFVAKTAKDSKEAENMIRKRQRKK